MSSPTPNHVVIIEDNVTTNNLLRDWLKLHFEVTCFLDAETALRLLPPSSNPIVFVVDYHLPGMTGLEWREKAGSQFPLGKYILISGLFDEKLLQEARDAGYDATIPKPFAMPVIFKKIQDLFGVPDEKPNLVNKLSQSIKKPKKVRKTAKK